MDMNSERFHVPFFVFKFRTNVNTNVKMLVFFYYMFIFLEKWLKITINWFWLCKLSTSYHVVSRKWWWFWQLVTDLFYNFFSISLKLKCYQIWTRPQVNYNPRYLSILKKKTVNMKISGYFIYKMHFSHCLLLEKLLRIKIIHASHSLYNLFTMGSIIFLHSLYHFIFLLCFLFFLKEKKLKHKFTHPHDSIHDKSPL